MNTIDLNLIPWPPIIVVFGLIAKLVHNHYTQKSLAKELKDFKDQSKDALSDLKSITEKEQLSITNGFHHEHTQIRESHDKFREFVYSEFKGIRGEQLTEQRETRKILEKLVESNTELNSAVRYLARDIENLKKSK